MPAFDLRLLYVFASALAASLAAGWLLVRFPGLHSRFSLDALVNIAAALGCRVHVELEAA